MKKTLYLKVLLSLVVSFGITVIAGKLFFMNSSPAPDQKSIAQVQEQGKAIVANSQKFISELFTGKGKTIAVPTIPPVTTTDSSKPAEINSPPAIVNLNTNNGVFEVSFGEKSVLKKQ